MRPLGRITAHLLPLALLVVAASARAADVIEYYDTDAVGNVRLVTDAAGNVVERHDYLPFGEEWCGTAVCGANRAPGEPLRFTGKERDAETGLDYFGARYYRANAGRFTTVDPAYTIQANLVDPQRWNAYAYGRNNPLRYVDPDGKSPTLVTAGVGFLIGVAAGAVGSTAAQFIRNGYSFKNFNVQDVGAAAAGGGASGALAGLTLGVSLVAETGIAGVAVVGAGSNVVGGAVTRALDSPEAGTNVIDAKAATVDAVAGGLGGVAGRQVGNMVRAPVGQMERTAAGMAQAARAGDYGAARGLRGIAASVAAKERAAQAADAVIGSKATNVVVPAWQASRERRETSQ